MLEVNSLGPIGAILMGVMVSFTPCVVVLFPITAYRFISDKGTDYKKYFLYVGGFLLSFVLIGFLFQGLLQSVVQSSIRFTLSITLIVLGLLQFFNRLNPLELKPVENTFIFGMLFALAVGINPCAIPFTGQVFSLSSNANILINLVAFGIGILLAPTLIVVFGNKLLSYTKKVTGVMHYIDKPMSILLIGSGVYMGLHILSFSRLDLLLSSALIFLLLLVVLKIFFINNSIKDLFTLPRLLLLGSILGLWVAVTYHCYGLVIPGHSVKVCSMTCEVCRRCLWLFGGSATLGVIGSLLLEKFEK
ncbi:MAG: hypothetical protein V5A57_02890 [Candidatus Paceibacterota bacterium]